MPVSSIIQQPVTKSLHAAYRPVQFRAVAVGSTPPPVVYCDIYFNDVYYRTISKTLFALRNTNDSEWVFDIQDAAQEYLKPFLAPNGDSTIAQALPIMAKAFCRFRSSENGVEGFIIPEGPAPVKGTATQSPVSGVGYQSNSFFIVNSTLQHEDIQNLESHLNTVKKGVWNERAFPLTHRPNQPIGLQHSDYFPVAISTDLCIAKIVLNYKNHGSTDYQQEEAAITDTCQASIIQITFQQQPASTNMLITWVSTGSPTSYNYSIDGGPWLSTAETSVLIADMGIGIHNINVVPVCTCAEGSGLLKSFTVADPATLCNSVVTITSVEQTGDRMVAIVFNSTGPATTWRYSLNGGSYITITNDVLLLEDLSIGAQSIIIEPVCDGGLIGAGDSADFEVTADPGEYFTFFVRYSVYDFDICGAPEIEVFSDAAWSPGITLYYDELLTLPIYGQYFVLQTSVGTVHTMDPSTAQVGVATLNTC